MDGIASYERRTSETLNGQEKQSRIIVVNRRHLKQLQLRANKYSRFTSNELVTSKYTLLNFLPKNLFEQFRRLANFYFLVIALLQALSPSSPVGPSTSLIPLVFVVSTTAIKQAYEDYLRHKVDAEINRRLVCVLRDKKIIQIESRYIIVGDIVYVTNNEELPCDAILLASSCDDRCHVTTANLDGETNLKLRNCFQIKHQIGDIEKIDDSIFILECDQPNATLYEFNGYLRTPKDEETANHLLDTWSSASTSSMGTIVNGSKWGSPSPESGHSDKILMHQGKFNLFKSSKSLKEIPKKQSTPAVEGSDCIELGLDQSNLLLRASRLKNTAFIYCLAIYTGKDTKMAHNSRLKPNKFSSIEHTVNRFLLVCFLLLLIFALASTMMFDTIDVWYLNHLNSDNERYDLLFLSHFLIFNYLVPISLYVTLEFVKFIGTLAVVNDKELRAMVQSSNTGERQKKQDKIKQTTSDLFSKSYSGSEKVSTNVLHHASSKISWEKPKCNSSDLNEELGQVQVLFSDKTGTLTENHMIFRACSAFGCLYRSTKRQRLYYQPSDVEPIPIPPIISRLRRTSTNRQALLSPLTPISPLLAKSTNSKRASSSSASVNSNSSSGLSAQMPPVKKLQLIKDLGLNEKIVDFFTCLILCSTVSLNETEKLEDCLPYKCANQYDYHSASPDEESLVSAAHKFGITMCKSNDRECYIIINYKANQQQQQKQKHDSLTSYQADRHEPGSSVQIVNLKEQQMAAMKINNNTNGYIVKRYERLCIFEFNSIRKRMSVIYRDMDNNKIYMACKGSEEMLDCIKLEGLDNDTERIANVTLAHFEAFAKSGLRTLLVAKKLLSQADCNVILSDLKSAMLTMGHGRSQRMTLVHQKAETELILIGATAVEDCLQDGVPETIADLKMAGIKVWLLTGDKVETATSVAYLCKLLDHDMIQFQLVRQQDSLSCGELLKKYKQEVDHVLNGDKLLESPQPTEQLSKLPIAAGSKLAAPAPASGANQQQTPSKSIAETTLTQARTKTIDEAALARLMDLDGRFLARQRNLKAKMKEVESQYKFALIADGRSLYYAMKSHRKLLASLCENCTTVLGCRLSPMQKAEIVRMIKNTPDNPVTAAIGDGANDVSMIQEAHVGIGVSGKEGRQAVNSSDFAIGRFKLLRRLFFVHGHLFYVRSARIINYFFYKNMIFILPQFIYGFYNGFTAQTIYSPMMLIGYNVFFTSLPIFAYGLTEKHIPVKLLDNFPRLYRMIRKNSLMTVNIFMLSLFLAILQAALIFYSMYHVWGSHTPFLESGKMAGIDGYSTILYFVIILLVSAQLLIITRSRAAWFNLTIIFSLVSLPCLLYLHSLINWDAFNIENTASGQFSVFARSYMFWLAIFVLTSLGFIPAMILGTLETTDYYREISDCLMQ